MAAEGRSDDIGPLQGGVWISCYGVQSSRGRCGITMRLQGEQVVEIKVYFHLLGCSNGPTCSNTAHVV
ncbi:hypothetical protein AG1IA_03688 [Rhizoctonia solani AG-1 IA]|uniref:Uncharacterized protein n=1 Tax=Thanatephorus cucumeris (strain AG1-IA) TaxID=983506 RepID=L8X104_THACA|nr:hypothetical protein AG1IA_03688 [Rhizoctonia solani AG-1 IA]